MIAVDPTATAATATFLEEVSIDIDITYAESWEEEIRRTEWDAGIALSVWPVTTRRTEWD